MKNITLSEARSFHTRSYDIYPGDHLVVQTLDNGNRKIAFVSQSIRTFGYANLMAMDDDKEIFEVVADA